MSDCETCPHKAITRLTGAKTDFVVAKLDITQGCQTSCTLPWPYQNVMITGFNQSGRPVTIEIRIANE